MKKIACSIGCLAAALAWGGDTPATPAVDAVNLGDVSKMVQSVVDQAMRGAIPATAATETAAGPRTWLGVSTDPLSDDMRSVLPEHQVGGLIVRHVDEDSPAAKAGIQAGDILFKLGDQILVNAEQLRQLIQLKKEGDKATLTGIRKGKDVSFDATLATKEGADESQPNVFVIGQPGGAMKMELPPEIKRMLESGTGGATVFSTSIVIRSSSSGGSSSFSSGGSSHSGSGNSTHGSSGGSRSGGSSLHNSGGKGAHSGGGSSAGMPTMPGLSGSSSGSSSGLQANTVNGKTTITYNGQQVYSGQTTGMVSTKASNENGEEYAAAFDGDKVLWENRSGAAEKLK